MLSPDGKPTSPLARLATRILSICPNSAACERLFSLLKRTITPARTRLTSRNLINVAELHAHLQQSHKRTGEYTRRLKRRLNPPSTSLPPGTTLHPASNPNEGSRAALSESMPTLQPSSLTPETSGSRVPDTSRDSEIADRDQDGDAEEDTHDSWIGDHSSQATSGDLAAISQSPLTLASIAESLIDMSNEDHAEPEPQENHYIPSSLDIGSPFRLDITEVFNFAQPYWITSIESQAESGLAEEIELHDLVCDSSIHTSLDIDVTELYP